jgi:Tol biopolymer transport system component
MTRRVLAAVMLVLAAAAGRAQVAPGGSPYLGQRPPGEIPRVFAPGIVSRGNIHSRLTISPDGREILWNTVDLTTFATQILSVRYIDGRWTDARPPAFATQGDTKDPVFSADGTRLYFMARAEGRWVTRCVAIEPGGWSAARDSAAPFNVSSSFTRSGRVYFSAEMKTKVWNTGIFSGGYDATGHADAAPLDAGINVPNAIDYTPYVSPDESFLLFTSNRPLVGDKEDMHIHVAFRTSDGAWSIPRKVFEIAGRFPSISPDGRYLFFCGDDGNIYWVDVKVLEPLRRAARGSTS